MPLGTEVGLGPGDIVLDGDPTPLPKTGAQPFSPIFGHVYCGQTAGSITIALGMEVGLDPGHIVLDRDAAPLPKKGTELPIFGPFLLCSNGWMHQDATLYGGRRQPKQLSVRWGPSPSPKRAESPIFGPRLLWPNGCMHQDATWCGGRPPLAQVTLCLMGPSPPLPKGCGAR